MNKRQETDLVVIFLALFLMTCLVTGCGQPFKPANSDVGPQGIQGPAGPTGPKGDQGPQGPGPVIPPQTPNHGTSCQITQTACPNHPSYVGSFPDSTNSSNANPVECMQRSSDYYTWCGMSHGQISQSTYTKDGSIVGQLTFGL